MIVFLDFDGVTHGIDNTISGMTNLFDSSCITALNEALLPFSDYKIVISSTWRLEYSLDELRQRLCILGDNVIDTTPDITPTQLFDIRGSREIECRTWLESNQIDEQAIAIDDQIILYERLPVYETQSNIGFCKDDILPFQYMVKSLK